MSDTPTTPQQDPAVPASSILTRAAPPETWCYTIEEAAVVLKAPPKTVRQQCLAGTLPMVRIGKHIRLPKLALHRVINGE